jgi:heavy metal sensor kinase
MKSIRLSLVVYFLGLLAAALGVTSFLVYRWGDGTLKAKRRATEALIQAQYQMREEEEKKRLDEALLYQAQTLARLVQFQVDWPRIRYHRELAVAGHLSACLNPSAYAAVPIWTCQGLRGSPIAREIVRRNLAHIKLDQDELLKAVDVDGQVGEYFQIDSAWGSSYYSESLDGRSLPLDAKTFAPDKVLSWGWDDTKLAPDIPVHRVILKTSTGGPVPRWRGPRPYSSGPGGRPPPPPTGGPREERADRRPPRPDLPRPAIFIPCAYDRSKLDTKLQGFKEERDRKFDALKDETEDSLKSLRNSLLAISTVTFAATVLGCFWLVRLGLTPLQRLSDAVGRISPKDFRLPLDARRLPGELQPIVRRLADTLVMLQRAFAREKQATADISHELRTPLAALLTTTEIALRKPRTAEQYQELLQDCRHSAQQMNQAVERLLTLARLDAGVDTLRPQAVDVAALAEQCVAVVRPLAEARGLRLEVHNKCAPQVTTDPDKLREVLTNLLHNAIQYNRPQGAIDLTVARENGQLNVEVRDTGIGIAPEAREQIFERFYRADPARGEDGLHAGLGLAIVKEYLNLMGGTIAVDSAPGQGSTFRLRLPVQPARPDEG